MKILITGSSGFLGRRAALHFCSLGHEVLTPSHKQMDITDPASVDSWFTHNQPQMVLHCAAISDTGACQKDPQGSSLVNVQGALHLAAACNRLGAKFLFCSSDQVYAGSPLPGPHKETDILFPNSVYAEQKLLAENRCRELCSDTVCLRLSWMYAAPPMPGEHGHLLTTLMAAIRDPRLPVTWPVHDRRGITDVDEVVDGLSLAMAFPPGVYNFGAENDANTYQTIRTVLEEENLTPLLDRLMPNRLAFSEKPRDIRMDSSLAAAYGVTFTSTVAGLRQAISRIRQELT